MSRGCTTVTPRACVSSRRRAIGVPGEAHATCSGVLAAPCPERASGRAPPCSRIAATASVACSASRQEGVNHHEEGRTTVRRGGPL